jgi:hypothetical protein
MEAALKRMQLHRGEVVSPGGILRGVWSEAIDVSIAGKGG